MTWYVAVDISSATYKVKSFLACALAATICIVPPPPPPMGFPYIRDSQIYRLQVSSMDIFSSFIVRFCLSGFFIWVFPEFFSRRRVFSQGVFLGGFEPWPPKFPFVGSRLGFSLSVLDVCYGFRWMLVVIVVLVLVMTGSVVPVPIVIFVINFVMLVVYTIVII